MKNFEQELYDFLTGTGRCASVPMPVHVTMAGELPVFDCGEGRLAVVAVPLDYFVRGGSVAELRQAAGAVAAAGTVYVYEDRWRGAGPLTRSMLEVRLGQGMRVFARNCGVRIITAETAAAFLERNHVYGPARSEIRLGLFRERATGAGEAAMDRTPQLAAVAVFSSGRRMDGGILSYEWVRYASLRGVRVTGGMGRLRLKAGVVAPVLVADLEPLAVIEDAYCPGRESELQKESLAVPALLDFRQEVLAGECSINGTEGVVADTLFLPDFPSGQRTDTGVELEVPGTVQVLSYGEDGVIQCGTGRWEARQVIAADEQSALWALPCFANIQAIPAAGGIQVKAEVNLGVTASGGLGIPMVTGVCLGESAKPDPGRPSLILRRAGDARLWDIAKSAGSTVSAIRKANNLQSEPAPDQMLLIPVP